MPADIEAVYGEVLEAFEDVGAVAPPVTVVDRPGYTGVWRRDDEFRVYMDVTRWMTATPTRWRQNWSRRSTGSTGMRWP